jgi:hypothetical protein
MLANRALNLVFGIGATALHDPPPRNWLACFAFRPGLFVWTIALPS